jgi:hypothetical protein
VGQRRRRKEGIATYDSPVQGLLRLVGLTREEKPSPVDLGYLVESEIEKVGARVIGVGRRVNV